MLKRLTYYIIFKTFILNDRVIMTIKIQSDEYIFVQLFTFVFIENTKVSIIFILN